MMFVPLFVNHRDITEQILMNFGIQTGTDLGDRIFLFIGNVNIFF